MATIPLDGAIVDARNCVPMKMQQFELTGDFIALNRLLKIAGICDSGGAGKALVARGEVRVDGAVELRKTAKIRAGQRIATGDQVIDVLRSPG